MRSSPSTIAAAIRQWAGRPYKHHYTLVFADRTQEVDISTWQTADRDLADASQAMGFVALPVAEQPKGAFDVHSIEASFRTEAHHEGQKTLGSVRTLAEGIAKVRKDHAALVAEKQRYDSDPAYALEQELKVCDWTSHYSDDYRVVRAGEDHLRKIEALKARVDPKVVEALYQKYQPKIG